jgi:hypothetical protein
MAVGIVTAVFIVGWLIGALILLIISIPFLLAPKSPILPIIQSWITESFDWIFKISRQLIENISENIPRQ